MTRRHRHRDPDRVRLSGIRDDHLKETARETSSALWQWPLVAFCFVSFMFFASSCLGGFEPGFFRSLGMALIAGVAFAGAIFPIALFFFTVNVSKAGVRDVVARRERRAIHDRSETRGGVDLYEPSSAASGGLEVHRGGDWSEPRVVLDLDARDGAGDEAPEPVEVEISVPDERSSS